MALAAAKLVTIVAERVLADRLTALVRSVGASGFTLTAASGEGSRGLGPTTVVDGENLRLEVLLSAPMAEDLMARLAADVLPDYAVVAWIADVAVVRGAKFGVPAGEGRPVIAPTDGEH